MRRMRFALFVSGLMLAISSGVADAAKDDLHLISRPTGTAPGSGDSDSRVRDFSIPGRGSAISDDGRYVTFISSADNLSTADNNGVLNIFVRDRETNTTTLVNQP